LFEFWNYPWSTLTHSTLFICSYLSSWEHYIHSHSLNPLVIYIMSLSGFSCTNFGRSCILQYKKIRCRCNKIADVKIFGTDRNPLKLFYACKQKEKEDDCGFLTRLIRRLSVPWQIKRWKWQRISWGYGCRNRCKVFGG
jgi:hypothetical protein